MKYFFASIISLSSALAKPTPESFPSPATSWGNLVNLAGIETSINSDGSLWHVNSAGEAFYVKSYTEPGLNGQVPSIFNAKRISTRSSDDGDSACHINTSNQLICSSVTYTISCTKVTGEQKCGSPILGLDWKQLPNKVNEGWLDVSLNPDGSLWGIANDGNNGLFYYPNYKDPALSWEDISYQGGGSKVIFSRISSTNDAICGVGAEPFAGIHCSVVNRNQIMNYEYIGHDSRMLDVTVSEDGSLFAVNNEQIFYRSHWKTSGWAGVQGQLASISSVNGKVCGANAAQQLFCSTY